MLDSAFHYQLSAERWILHVESRSSLRHEILRGLLPSPVHPSSFPGQCLDREQPKSRLFAYRVWQNVKHRARDFSPQNAHDLISQGLSARVNSILNSANKLTVDLSIAHACFDRLGAR